MSIGNLRDQGNKGNNFPYQLASLKLLQSLINNTTTLLSETRTPVIIRTSTSGTIAPLVYSFSVSNVGTSNGTILGQTIKSGETFNFDAGAINNSYAAGTISYDGTGTELVIIYNI